MDARSTSVKDQCSLKNSSEKSTLAEDALRVSEARDHPQNPALWVRAAGRTESRHAGYSRGTLPGDAKIGPAECSTHSRVQEAFLQKQLFIFAHPLPRL